MRYPAKFDKARLFGQVAAVALIAGLSAGCSADVDRFGSLFETTENRAQIVPSDTVVTGSVAPAPTTSVTSGALPPPTQPVLQTSAPGTGWSATGGTRITVGTGESLQVLSTRYGVPVAAIASANNIPPNALLAPGQSLLIPSYASAPAGAAPTQTAVASTGGGAGEIYVVKPGDSLGRIANDRGFKSIEVATFNGIDPSAPIKVGQKLKIPPSAGAPRTQVAALGAPAATASDAAPLGQIPAAPPIAAAPTAPEPGPNPPAPDQATQVAVVQPQVQTKPELPAGVGVESAASGNFRWPVRGRVVSGFGVKASGERNDGINIEVPEGTPIKAAEGGTVIYAGNELKGYGNLVLVKHPNGFVSAYAHASEILVKRDDVIMRGQTIGKVGATGNVPRPQLHFEIREGNKPVDPLPHLSG